MIIIVIFISSRPLIYKALRFRVIEWQKNFINESILSKSAYRRPVPYHLNLVEGPFSETDDYR